MRTRRSGIGGGLAAITRLFALAFIVQNVAVLLMTNHFLDGTDLRSLSTPLLDKTSVLSATSENSGESSTSHSKIRGNNVLLPRKRKTQPGTPENKSQYAYVFLVAGCNPKKPQQYVGYIYNILISKHILQQSGSKADVVVLTRMSSETNEEVIPEQELWERAGIIVRYLPKVHTDNFYSAMLDKFQILHMTEYKRVVFMDSDVTPFCNLDYMFESSVGPDAILAPNVVISYKHEPAQGGFFMVEPKDGDYEKLQEIIEYRTINFHHFSAEYGWGHKIIPPDSWDSMNQHGEQHWDFYGAYADQGLLYHWMKYEKSDVTIVHFKSLRQWGEVNPKAAPSSLVVGPIAVTEVPEPRRNKTIGFLKQTSDKLPTCGGQKLSLKRGYHNRAHPPCSDYHHFTGAKKPWLQYQKPDNITEILKTITDHSKIEDTTVFWYYWLNRVSEEMDLNIDIQGFEAWRPNLGLKIPKKYMYDFNEKHRDVIAANTDKEKRRRLNGSVV